MPPDETSAESQDSRTDWKTKKYRQKYRQYLIKRINSDKKDNSDNSLNVIVNRITI